jgi:hypothetical protein
MGDARHLRRVFADFAQSGSGEGPKVLGCIEQTLSLVSDGEGTVESTLCCPFRRKNDATT